MKCHENKRSEAFLFFVIGKNVGLVHFALNVAQEVSPTGVLKKLQHFGQHQISANRGPDSRFVLEANIKVLMSKLNSSQVIIQVGVEANNDHRFVIGAYTNYFQVGKFLTNSDARSSYSPKLDQYQSKPSITIVSCPPCAHPTQNYQASIGLEWPHQYRYQYGNYGQRQAKNECRHGLEGF